MNSTSTRVPIVIVDREGHALYSSADFACVRMYASRVGIDVVAIDQEAHGTGRLSILFNDGAVVDHDVTSFTLLKVFIRNWPNAHGISLVYNCGYAGRVTFDNPYLHPDFETLIQVPL